MVMNPVTSQAAMRSAGELVRRAISAETIKIPEPIMEPMTSVVALVRPSSLASSLGCSAGFGIWILLGASRENRSQREVIRRGGGCVVKLCQVVRRKADALSLA